MFKRGLLALTLILMGATTSAVLLPTDSVQAACPSGKILTIKPWYDGLLESDCSIKSPDKVGGLSPFIWKIVLNIVEDLLQLAGYVAVGFIIYGGFQFMTSSGSPDQAAKAQKTIINAAIGLVIAIASIGLVNLIALTALGI